ncbi:LexA repressor [Campylobacter majalis]|uniref:LexA repressor n=1 Tax=Campylobacter majalis TaxID=2790656 RepID=A0ABN7K8N1_9BACT|nr:XRE family transcriptional regulator [Campylobacter majalis]CAD7288811.1 LexA repressor [Campylobacter majalis]
MNTQNLGEKIRNLRKNLGFSQKDFAKKIGVSYGSLQSYEYGEIEPKRHIINTICITFNKPFNYFYENESIAELIQNTKNQKQYNLNFYKDVRASAGYGAFSDDGIAVKIPVNTQFLSEILQVEPQEYDIIKATGDSMEPFIKDADLVLVDKKATPQHGDIVIAMLDECLYVKKYLIDPIKNEIKLTSLNSFYQDIIITKDDLDKVRIIGKVRAKFNLETTNFK